MIRIILIALLLGLVTPAARAAEIAVRSGEHDQFTRLVLRIDNGTEWTLDNGEDGATLSLSVPDIVFKYDDVFNRIPRKRLRDMSQASSGGPLHLKFACACEAVGFVEAGTYLVVDIRERTNERERAFQLPIVSGPDILAISTERSFLRTGETWTREGSERGEMAKPTSSDQRNDVQRTASNKPSISVFERQLQSRLLRGAQQSLLTLAPNAAPHSDQAELRQTATSQIADGANVIVTTAADRDLTAVFSDQMKAMESKACVSDDAIAIANWGNGVEFSAQLRALRSGIYQEFDRPDRDQILRLGRHYLYFGFAVEARAVSGMLPEGDAEAEILASLADVVERQSRETDTLFHEQQSCPGDAALWSMLAERRADPDLQTGAVLRAYSKLPDPLRFLLGPIAAELLTEGGYAGAAHHILRSLKRSGGADESATALVDAELASLEGKPESQEQALETIVKNDGAPMEAPRALAKLIDKRAAEGGGISDKELDLIASYAKEFETSEIGPDLILAHSLALALTGSFDAALSELSQLQETNSDIIVPLVRDKVYARISDAAGDIEFLRHASGMPKNVRDELKTATATKMAVRLAELGFFEDALLFADRSGDRLTRRSRSILIARSEIGAGRPHRALLELNGLNSDDANRTRADALQVTQQWEAAVEVFNLLGDVNMARRSAWLADRPDESVQSPQTRYGTIIQLSKTSLDENPDLPKTPLARAAAIVNASGETRMSVTRLLDAVD